MSPSPTGPGSWTLASMPAGRETSGVGTGAQRRRQSFAERFNGGLALSAAGGKPQRSKSELLWIETAEGTTWTTTSCRKSEIELSWPYEQSCAFAFQDRKSRRRAANAEDKAR